MFSSWELRHQIAKYKKAYIELQPKVYHIKKELNGIAHDCAQQEIRHSQSLLIFSCSSLAYVVLGNRSFVFYLQNLVLQEIVIHVVNCLCDE
jgi:hypothetical protein